MQNEILPTLISPNPKLKLSLFRTHFVLPKPVIFALSHATVARIAGGTISHNKSQKNEKTLHFSLYTLHCLHANRMH